MNLKSWAESERGRSMALAKAIDVPPSFVSKMLSGEKAIPAEHCQAIFAFTGGQVSIPEMRDDWLKYWPELDQAPAIIDHQATESVATSAPECLPISAQRRQGGRRELGAVDKRFTNV